MGSDQDHAGHSHAGAGHSHSHATGTPARLAFVLVITAIYMVAESVGGWLSHSLALIADAGHMLSDVAALALSLVAARMSRRPPTPARSYGFHRTEILAALANAATLIGISGWVSYEAIRRLQAPPEVAGTMVMWIASGGFVVNLLGMWVLSGGRHDNLNVRGAWLHVATDALGNIGTVFAGAAIAWFGWGLADPIASLMIAALVCWSSWHLLKESLDVLMEGTPAGIDPSRVRTSMTSVEGVDSVHDLHIWSITSGRVSLSAHVGVDGTRADREILPALCERLRDDFSITHVTLQLEAACTSHETLHE